MARYIDAEALEKSLICEIRECEEARDAYYGDEMYDACVNSRETAMRHIQSTLYAIPTADVEEVRHGEWKDVGEHYCQCSICTTMFEALPTKSSFKADNIFCRHCGAKMDGGDKV